jgi:uncharacterized protein (DUF1501 family)
MTRGDEAMANYECLDCLASRRQFLRGGLLGLGGLGVGAAIPGVFGRASFGLALEGALGKAASHPERILVVVELSGGNDGLDTVIPYGDDNYHRVRPTLGQNARGVLRIDDRYGLHPSLAGLKTLWDDGLVAAVHGCGYPNPDRSHFSSMEYWHTAKPHQVETRGWIGRLADAAWPDGAPNTIVNVALQQSKAVQAERHAPVVFSNPEEFVRAGDAQQAGAYEQLIQVDATGNEALDFLARISRDAQRTSRQVREVIRDYQTPVAYGSTPLAVDLRKVAALIEGGFPTRVYYVSLGGFDTHAGQVAGRFYLLTGLGEALRAFHEDLRRMGRRGDVLTMMWSEFGRRVEENASQGTDHGTAGPMFLMGEAVKPGFAGQHPSLTDLDENGDLQMTVDFRRVYATAIQEWLGYQDSRALFAGEYPGLGLVKTPQGAASSL